MTAADLINHAIQARTRAYAPYSKYQVGAAVLASDGTVIQGCNVENASYPATICAERVALTSAVALGKEALSSIAVVTQGGASPCGICRQVMMELGPEMTVYLADVDGNYRSTTVRELLPDSFDAQDLDISSR